jgi:hypothetical protein
MDNIIEKLKNLKNGRKGLENWTLKEQLELLEMYYIISKQEASIFELIYANHGCDSWEDIFRDYNIDYLEVKAEGVQVAIDTIKGDIKEGGEDNKS